jgi:hypothetical protein
MEINQSTYKGDTISTVDPVTKQTIHGIRHGKGSCTFVDGSIYDG